MRSATVQSGKPLSHAQRLIQATSVAEESVGFLSLLHQTGDVFEIRSLDCPEVRGRTFKAKATVGYFDSVPASRQAIQSHELTREPPNIYVSINPVDTDLLSRSCNRIQWNVKHTANDENIVRRTNFLIDIDPIRLSGVSSTDVEMQDALECADAIELHLRDLGWSEPIYGMSGNGAYLIYRVDLPNDDESRDLIKSCLHALGNRFSTPTVNVDLSTFNASRICKVLGTFARKGDNYPGTPRPHRQSWYRQLPGQRGVVTGEQLRALANSLPADAAPSDTGTATENPQAEGSASACRALPKSAIPKIRERARAYIAKIPGGVDGRGGSRDTLEAACSLFRFALDDESAWELLTEFNKRCEPFWSIPELEHKLKDAKKKVIENSEWGKHLSPGDWLDDYRELANYRIELVVNEEGAECKIKTPIPQKQLVDSILQRFEGWPKRYAGQLFICRDGELEVLAKPNQLFSWMRESSDVKWGRGEAMVNRDELYSSLLRHAEVFEDVQHYPHFPKVDRVYYSCPDFQPGEGRHLARFLDFFSPATAVDHQLILASIATTLWGGLAGQRPAFLYEAEARAGQGSGKSTAAQLIGRLTGGYIDLPTKKIDIDEIKKQFLNSTAASQRVALLDNVKTSNFSDPGVESLMTSPIINGHKMYIGNSSRPNFYTWFITMNGPKLSRDFAQRCVSILLSRPEHSGDWLVKVTTFIEQYRQEIFSDVAGFFQRPQQKLSVHSRWGTWEEDIVTRLENPNAVVKVIQQREAANDVDATIASDIEAYVQQQLERYGFNEPTKVHIPNARMFNWTCNAIEENDGVKRTTSLLDRLENCGCFAKLRKNPSRANGRGWIFGSADGEVDYNLEELIQNRNGTNN